MPMKWVPPKVAVPAVGQYPTVYHTYKNGQWDEPAQYWFTTSYEEEDGAEFDIREFPDYDPNRSRFINIVAALEAGWIK